MSGLSIYGLQITRSVNHNRHDLSILLQEVISGYYPHLWLLNAGNKFHKVGLCVFTSLVKTAPQLHFCTEQVFS